jgi:hypothetical protein
VVGERKLKIAYARGMFYYLGKYRITIYSNGFVETAREREIIVDSWIDIDPVEEPMMSEIDLENPLGFTATFS